MHNAKRPVKYETKSTKAINGHTNSNITGVLFDYAWRFCGHHILEPGSSMHGIPLGTTH